MQYDIHYQNSGNKKKERYGAKDVKGTGRPPRRSWFSQWIACAVALSLFVSAVAAPIEVLFEREAI